MTRGFVTFLVNLGDNRRPLHLAFSLGVGAAPLELRVFPGNLQGEPTPYDLKEVLEKLASALSSKQLREAIVEPEDEGKKSIWADAFKVEVLPELLIAPTGDNPNFQATLKVFNHGKYGLKIGVEPIEVGGFTVRIEPQITIYEFGIKCVGGKLTLDATVDYGEVSPSNDQKKLKWAANTLSAKAKAKFEPPKSAQKIGYPFPVPETKALPFFRLNYLGIGQRFGLDLDLNDSKPIASALGKLKKELTATTPESILPELAKYYHPERDWFVAIDFSLRGWEVKVLFNDPTLYGIEISSRSGQFEGLSFEILYQKLSSGTGVYYGALTLPAKFRSFQFGAAAFTLPNFKLWIYDNGDFRLAVGWPLWENAFTVEVGTFMGRGGFYFGKLRAGDLPKTDPQTLLAGSSPAVDYNPILQFGLGLELGLGRSYNSGPLSALMFVGLRGVFQGLLAWEVRNGKPGSLSRSPDYFWFSASVGLVGTVQGTVNLAVVNLSFSVAVNLTAAIAFETDCWTELNVSAHVAVSAKIKILFVRVSVSFHATVEVSFRLGDGRMAASAMAPTNPNFQHAIPRLTAAQVSTARLGRFKGLSAKRVLFAPASPPQVALHFLLYPTVDYNEPVDSQLQAICGLNIEKAEFQKLLESLSAWLISDLPAGGDAVRDASGALTSTKKTKKTPHGLRAGDAIFIVKDDEVVDGPRRVIATSRDTFKLGTDGIEVGDTCKWKISPWESIVARLGTGTAPAPADFREKITAFLAGGTFTISGIDLTPSQPQTGLVSGTKPYGVVIEKLEHGLAPDDRISVVTDSLSPTVKQYTVATWDDDHFAIIGYQPEYLKTKEVTWTKDRHELQTFVFAMPPVLRFSSGEPMSRNETSVNFANHGRTPTGYSQILQSYLAALSELDGRTVGPGGDCDNRTMADIVFYDYLLLLCRQLAHAMAAGGPESQMTDAIIEQVGGAASHYLLHGLRLPKPGALAPPGGEVWEEQNIAGLYKLTGQQFTVKEPEDGLRSVSVSLSVSDGLPASDKPLASAFRFAPDLSATTARLPLPAVVPPQPDTSWWTPGNVKRLPGVVKMERWFGVHNRVEWTSVDAGTVGAPQSLIQIPQQLLDRSEEEPTALEVYTQPQAVPDKRLHGFSYALRVPLNISLISGRHPGNTATSPRNATSNDGQDLPGIYRIDGVDEANRDRLGALLEVLKGPHSPLTLHILLPSPNGASFTSSSQDEDRALFLKTSLSTERSPVLRATPVETADTSDPASLTHPAAAGLKEVAGVLRLLYEASIVHRDGFFLSWPRGDGGGFLPASIFKDGAAELELIICMEQAASSPKSVPYTLQRHIQNTLVVPTSNEGVTVYLRAMSAVSKGPLSDYHPQLPQGSIGFEIVRPLPPETVGPLHPFAPEVIEDLYGFLQYRIRKGKLWNLKYRTSGWSGAISRTSQGKEVGSDAAPPTYLATVPIWRHWSTRRQTDPTAAIQGQGTSAILAFRLVDIFGNVMPRGAAALADSADDVIESDGAELDHTYSLRIPQYLNDPIIVPSAWPGVRVGYAVSGEGRGDPSLNITLLFEPSLQWYSSDPEAENLLQVVQRYQQIIAQFSDTLLKVQLASSLMAEREESTLWRSELESWVKEVFGCLLPIKAIEACDPPQGAGGGSFARVKSPEHGLLADNVVLLANTNSVPPIDGERKIIWLSSDEFAVEIERDVECNGTAGRWDRLIEAVGVGETAVVTSPRHGLSDGAVILIVGSDATPTIDGLQTITVLTHDTFTVPVAVAAVGGRKGVWSRSNVRPLMLSNPLKAEAIAKKSVNIFQLEVSMRFERDKGGIDPLTTMLGTIQQAEMPVRPLIGENMSDQRMARGERRGRRMRDAVPSAPLSLETFAQAFETAYTGFDGDPASKLKLAVLAEQINHSDKAGRNEFWAVCMSPKNGSVVSVPMDTPAVAFTMAPLSTTLATGTATVKTYDNSFQPSESIQVFNEISLDDWMRTFLLAMELLLSPSAAPALARLDPDKQGAPSPFERLMAVKKTVANQLACRVVPVFQTIRPNDWRGNLPVAQEKFEQTLLENLSQAYQTDAIMQTQVRTARKRDAREINVKHPPRFYGALLPRRITAMAKQGIGTVITSPQHGLVTGQLVTITESDSTPIIDGVWTVEVQSTDHFKIFAKVVSTGAKGRWQLGSGSEFTISNPTLELGELAVEVEQALTWMINAKRPENPFVEFTGDYTVTFLEHRIGFDAEGKPVDQRDGADAYLTSSWLRFLLTDDPLLNYPLGKIKAPVPRREFPSVPTIEAQYPRANPQFSEAGLSPESVAKDACKWDYTLTVAERGLDDGRNDLHVQIGYNILTASDFAYPRFEGANPTSQNDISLFEALAQFATSYQGLSGLLPRLQSDAFDKAVLSPPAAAIARLAETVSKALDDDLRAKQAARKLLEDDQQDKSLESFTDSYVVEFLHAHDKIAPHLSVYVNVMSPVRKITSAICVLGRTKCKDRAHGLSDGEWIAVRHNDSGASLFSAHVVKVSTADDFTVKADVCGYGDITWQRIDRPTIGWVNDDSSVVWTKPSDPVLAPEYSGGERSWLKMSYQLPPRYYPSRVVIRWEKLSILERQMVIPQFKSGVTRIWPWICREQPQTPIWVYKTPLVSAARLMPYLDLPQVIEVSFASNLRDTLSKLLRPMIAAKAVYGTTRKSNAWLVMSIV